MAEVDYEDYGAAPRFNGHIAQRMINIAGALCSVAIVIGVAVWGYKLAVRDVNGVPVIRASADPMRVPPATPGGEIADHQGMAVNVIAERGAVEVLPDEIVLAPAPVELTAEDEPGLAQNLTAQADGTGSAAAPSLGASPDQIASVDTLSAGMIRRAPILPLPPPRSAAATGMQLPAHLLMRWPVMPRPWGK